MISSVVVKHLDVETVSTIQKAQCSEKNYTDEELDFAAFISREPLKAYEQDKSRLQAAMVKSIEIQLEMVKEKNFKAPMDKAIDAVVADIDSAEKAFVRGISSSIRCLPHAAHFTLAPSIGIRGGVDTARNL